jgi:hypothetical protein
LRVGSNQGQCLAITPAAVSVQGCNSFAVAQLFATRATTTTVTQPDPCDGDLDIDSDCGDDANAATTTRAYPTTTGPSIVMRVQRFLNPACTGVTATPCVAQGTSASERKEYTAQAHFIRAIRDVPQPTGTVDWEVSLPSGYADSKKRIDVAVIPTSSNDVSLYEVKKNDNKNAAVAQLRDYVSLFQSNQINAIRGKAAQSWARRYPDYRGTIGGVWVVWRDPQDGIVLFETIEKVNKWPASAFKSSLLNATQLTYQSVTPPSSTTTVFIPGTTATPSRKRKKP